MKTSSLIMVAQGMVLGMVGGGLLHEGNYVGFILAALANPILTVLYSHAKAKGE